MTPDIQFKRGGTLPNYTTTLYRPDSPDTPLPLAGATVRLVAADRLTRETIIDQELEILDAAEGLCQYTHDASAFDAAADCKAEIVVTFGDGGILILPTSGQYQLVIEDSLI
ncbi:BppU family phage baseplate upper protein [Methanogenium cariaci]|jgi:baseplate upper protein BppU